MAQGTPLKVWFVNVGHGDCTIVKFPSGRVMMVDICNSKTLDQDTRAELLKSAGWLDDNARSRFAAYGLGNMPYTVAEEMRSYERLLDDPIDDVLKTDPELQNRNIFRFVVTHPDMDHMTGIYRLFQQEESIDVVNMWDTENTKKQPKKTGKGYDERDWKEYQRAREQKTDPKVLFLYRGATGEYYADDNISILSPTTGLKDECNDAEDWNNVSQVLRITYGESSLLLPGDTESKAQQEMVDYFGDQLQSTILKASHHGRDSGYHNDFVRAVSPEYTIVSVGKKENDASGKYRQHTRKKVFSTRFMGTMYAELFADGDVRIWNSPKKGKERIDEGANLAAALARILLDQRGQTGLRI